MCQDNLRLLFQQLQDKKTRSVQPSLEVRNPMSPSLRSPGIVPAPLDPTGLQARILSLHYMLPRVLYQEELILRSSENWTIWVNTRTHYVRPIELAKLQLGVVKRNKAVDESIRKIIKFSSEPVWTRTGKFSWYDVIILQSQDIANHDSNIDLMCASMGSHCRNVTRHGTYPRVIRQQQ
jgi:hypothetical protein